MNADWRNTMDYVVVDVEIVNPVESVEGGWDATDKLGVAVACVWEYATQRMRVYGPGDVKSLQDRLLKADRITGFNILKFDLPLIWGKSQEQWARDRRGGDWNDLLSRCDDLLARIWVALGLDPYRFDKRTHGGWRLENVARSTLGVGKIGNGADAPRWYQEALRNPTGQESMSGPVNYTSPTQSGIQRVANYCSDDVALERDLSDFIDRYGYVLNDWGKGNSTSPTKVYLPRWDRGEGDDEL